jgi:hypothetical protein
MIKRHDIRPRRKRVASGPAERLDGEVADDDDVAAPAVTS